MNYNQLSIDQAPSISAPFIFFLSAPLFAIAAALILIFNGPEIFQDRWLAQNLAITHLVTLGFITMVMIGAIFQLLPVLAGAPIPRPELSSRVIYGFYASGVICLATGFNTSHQWLIKIALFLLAIAFLVLLILVSIALFKSDVSGGSAKGMRYSITGLWIAVILGLTLAAGHAWDSIPLLRHITGLHIAWAGIGWISMMIISIAYQVIPMFQITANYPKIIDKHLSTGVFLILLIWSLSYYAGTTEGFSLQWLKTLTALTLSLLLIAFASMTIRMQIQRKKRMADATLYFWLTGLINLIIALLLYCFASLLNLDLDFLIGIVFFIGFAISIINGMLYKIVPFLVWLHLHRKLAFKAGSRSTIPTMNDVISSRKSLLQLYLHTLALLLTIAAVFMPERFTYLAAITWLINWSLLSLHLIQSILLYRSCLTSK
ncbi:MAG: hypothetical protein OQK76_07960 [Gammaproteobacteria bacterium]|nr:hypothetical protein [Gammaproteobacteria bacterium]MCW8910539.1 hypothetical protein [Gammaproteobacteria bacterium]MCW9004714.1 hypothetical protein [Gammaproteobacteria bacterium]MCW9056542.1 hypothetical protein [Gammaproteobacteria bacterium]